MCRSMVDIQFATAENRIGTGEQKTERRRRKIETTAAKYNARICSSRRPWSGLTNVTDRQTGLLWQYALCTMVHRAVKTSERFYIYDFNRISALETKFVFQAMSTSSQDEIAFRRLQASESWNQIHCSGIQVLQVQHVIVSNATEVQ